MSIQQALTDPSSLSTRQGTAQPPCWYAVHTRSRFERKVEAQLIARGIESFLPLLAQKHKWSDRQKIVQEPLFPGYIFVRETLEAKRRLAVLQTTGVVEFVGAGGHGASIPDVQIENVRTLLTHNISFSPWPFLRAGQRVRIRGGSLDGIEGILLSKNADCSIVVSIDLIQKSLAIRLKDYDLTII